MAAVWLLFVWPLLGLCVPLHASENSRSPGLDLLLPYSNGHGPAHSHRRVRECQPLLYGNSTHQTWRADSSQDTEEAESRVFITSVEGSSGPRWVHGHMTVVSDPLRTLSVLEPGGPGGCGLNRVTPVEQTARWGGCLFAQNAGFFNTRTTECLGNVVSEGRLVRNSRGVQNAQFGIRSDGSLVFGYLSEEEVLQQKNPFVQLVSGVVWLLRDGQVYINESLQAECDETQMTGAFRYFVDVISARTAVGHDAAGRVVLVQIDGQTKYRGMSLVELANFLKENGVINAINLDGGGSSTFVKNRTLASYPSDHCASDSRWRCARSVSTALCVHARRCGAGCGEHGVCGDSGRCECERGWSGETCDRPQCEAEGCGPHGICIKKGCACDAGWTGHNCSQVCPSGLFGDGCNQTCACLNGAPCDPVHGLCSCAPGFTGDKCQNVCPVGWFGASCSEECNCSDSCYCDALSGRCNVSLSQETQRTLHSVEKCRAKQMFKSWRRDEETKLERRYLSERSWLIFSLSVALLLLCLSLSLHLLSWWRSSPLSSHSAQRDYSYVPLHDINGSLTSAHPGLLYPPFALFLNLSV
uniref:N-acetylglucosamine-1-phosphodiester alpha-N-acetylglucosaminidase n=1 Tax=Neogobius melanostomus TaxID=47308 RepID=A0A8C6WL75_9GOBI